MTRKRPRPRGAAPGLPAHIPSILATAANVQEMIAQGINPDGSLSPEAIRALLKFKGVDIRALAKATGYTDPQFHQVINREYRNEAIENAIAEALGLKASADRIWGRSSIPAA